MISFELPQAMAPRLTISDVSGRLVKSIEIDGQQGLNEILVAKKDLGSTGVLYYQLETSSNILVKKMVITQ